jgi:hypothetical protein
VRLKLLLLGICSLFLFSASHVTVASGEIKLQTPFLEMRSNSIELTPIAPKVGPGGEPEIVVTLTKNSGG